MEAKEPRWVLCDGASHLEAPADALRVGIGEGPWHQVSVDIEGLEDRMSGTLPDALRDLIRLATFTLAADCATSRGTVAAVDNGLTWRRDFRFVVPVSDPDRWNQASLRLALANTLGFLSDERFRFEFVPLADGKRGGQIRFSPPGDGRTFASWKDVDDVLLFSGGMDSFSGAVDACLGARTKPLLVSHRSSGKMKAVQRRLVDALRGRTGGPAPWYLGIDVHRHGRELHHEESQRTRSFLFAAIAGAVSWLAGHNRIRFHENGIIALNLPIAAQLQGARGTRTVHPRVLDGFARILALVADQAFVVDNPYQWMTRGDVATRIQDAGVRELLRHTRSCAAIRASTKMHPACGVCSQCIDRQFAVRARGLRDDDPEEMYAVRAFADPMEVDRDVQLALGYVGTAKVFAGLSGRAELVNRFGEILDASPELARQWSITEDEVLDRVVDLHRRQGQMVRGVMDSELAARSGPVFSGDIHPHSLLARCIEGGLNEARRAFGVEDAELGDDVVEDSPSAPAAPYGDGSIPALGVADPLDPASLVAPGVLLKSDTFVEVGHGWLVGLAGTRGVIARPSSGMTLVQTMLRHPHRDFLALDLETAAKGADPANVDGAKGRRKGKKQEVMGATTPGALPTLDAAAVAAFKKRIAVLRAEEEEATDMSDAAGAERAREEREQIEDQLARDIGPGGRARDVAPEVDKARTRLSKAVDRAVADIGTDGHLALKQYLKNTLKTGFSLKYQPGEARSWVTTR